MKICFLLSFTPNPRMNKRMKTLGEKNEVSLIYWRRTRTYIWGNVSDIFNKSEIYIPTNMGQPLKRIFPTFKFAKKALNKLKEHRPNCIYLSGIDMLAIATFYKNLFAKEIKIVYEVADLHGLQVQPPKNVLMKLFQKALRSFERKLCKNVSLLVCTSQGFYESYYSDFIPRDKYLYMANAPEKKIFESYQKKSRGAFTVGFVGAVRFNEQIKLLVNAAKKCGIEVVIAGSFLDDDLQEYCINNGAVCTGTYNYETDIVNLYEKLDCVFSVYPSKDENVKLALPNKLYESIICELPIIVAKGTYLSELVEKYQVGISVDSSDINQYIEALTKLSSEPAYYQEFAENCKKIRDKCFVEMYNLELNDRIKKISRGE